MVNNLNMLTTERADKTIIQSAISSLETFDGNKNKFEGWITSVENVAKISSQDIL